MVEGGQTEVFGTPPTAVLSLKLRDNKNGIS